jgi:SAM-dependent methyltransferase
MNPDRPRAGLPDSSSIHDQRQTPIERTRRMLDSELGEAGARPEVAAQSEVQDLLEALATAAKRTPAVIDRYYTLCIPFYREFLGNHWHTGFYSLRGPIGMQDQLRMEEVIAASADLASARDVLDVGCGIGGPACHLATRTSARARGLTPNSVQLDLARALAREANLADRVTFDRGSASELPYADESFDVVLFFESPCHFPDRDLFFREVNRVLRPGGRLAGEDWLAADGLSDTDSDRYIRPICDTWAIPALGTVTGYASGMAASGLAVREAVDLRDEMALLRGFLVDAEDRAEVAREIEQTKDPIRQVIMQGLLRLGAAVAAGAFTLGRFLAVKEARPS